MAVTRWSSLLFVSSLLVEVRPNLFDEGKCEPINELVFCKSMQYNDTSYPNMLGHESQKQAAEDFKTVHYFAEASCSQDAAFFMCSVYAPMCSSNTPENKPLTSCRSVCLRVQRDCADILKNFKLGWPKLLACDLFPDGSSEDDLCMDPQKSNQASRRRPPKGKDRRTPNSEPPAVERACPAQMVARDAADERSLCQPLCNSDLLFSDEDKNYAEILMVACAAACMLVTGFVIVTFAMDVERFRFPERPIVYLAICYHVFSWSLIGRAFMSGQQAACEQRKSDEQMVLVSGTLTNFWCVIVFMVGYSSSTASHFWWLVLAFSWYLSAAKKWGAEALHPYTGCFHFVAWGFPLILTIAVLVTHNVAASELTSVCSVGNLGDGGFWRLCFVVVPSVVLLVVGLGLLLVGFYALLSILKTLRRGQRRRQGAHQEQPEMRQLGDPVDKAVPLDVCSEGDIERLKKLMYKIAAFSIMYIIATLALLATELLHINTVRQWEQATVHCRKYSFADCQSKLPHEKPMMLVYLVNVVSSLVVGVATGIWVVSKKTWFTWKTYVCCFMRPADEKPPAAAGQHPHQQPQALPLIPCRPSAPLLHGQQQQQTTASSHSSSSHYPPPPPPLSYRPAPALGQHNNRYYAAY